MVWSRANSGVSEGWRLFIHRGISVKQPVRPLLGALTALALVGAACSSDDDSSSDGTEAPSAEVTEAPEETDPPSTDTSESTDPPSADGSESSDPPASDAPAEDEYPDRDTFVPISDVPGVSDDQIAYASLATKANNPLGTDIKDAYNEGINAYFAWRNSEGGIYGRELALPDEIDDEFTSNQAKALEIIGADDRFGVFVATLLFSGAEDLEDAGIPTYVWNISSAEVNGRTNLFGHTAVSCPAGCTARVKPYLANSVGAEKIGILGYGVSENSKQGAITDRASFELYESETGASVVYFNDDLAFGLPNGIGPEVTAMKDAGVDFVATSIDLNGMKTLAQEMQRQGMDDVVLYHPNTYNQEFVAEAGDLFNGDLVVPSFLPFEYDTDLEAQKKFFEFMEAQGSDLSELAMIGWLNADLAFTGLLEAGPEFDQASVIAATNELTEYDAGGLINPIDWTRQHNGPTPDDQTTNGYLQECFSAVLVEGSVFVNIGDPKLPFLCWSNETKDFAEPVPTDFG